MARNERISIPLWWKLLLSILSSFLLALQIALFVFSFRLFIIDAYSVFGWIYVIAEVLSFITVCFIIRRSMPTNYKITWCVLILLLPVPFVSLYTLNQMTKSFSERSYRKHQTFIAPEDDTSIMESLKVKNLHAYTMAEAFKKSEPVCVYENTGFVYFKDARDKHMDMLQEIRGAKSFIYLEYFIINDGRLMDELYPILLDRGSNGVEIRIIYDDLGSRGAVFTRLWRKLSEIPNLKLCAYGPIGLSFYLLANYRDHRKVCIIDGRVAYCGGDNLSDEYIHKKERFGYWRDTCGKYTGAVVKSFIRMFLSTWDRITGQKSSLPLLEEENVSSTGFVMPVWDGPTNRATPMYDMILSMIESAEHYVYISTPYFVIDDAMIALLVRKIKSGVDVRILMPGIPDKRAVYYLGRLNYRDIYKAGGCVFEYTKGFNHSKEIIVDDHIAFLGTVNMDYRSLFLHYECGALIVDHPEILSMKEDFLHVLEESQKFDYAEWHRKKWYQRLIGYIVSIFATLL